MFYLFLTILSLAELYFFRLLNQFIFENILIPGDFIFSILCIGFAFFILTGTLHVKHLNKDWLKKTGFIVIALGCIVFLVSIFSFQWSTILNGLEWTIILSITGYFIYYYQTVPEGEPDPEVDESDFDSGSGEYFSLDMLDTDGLYQMNQMEFEYNGESYADTQYLPEIEKLIETLQSILDIENLEEELSEDIYQIKYQVDQINLANSEYKPENINDIILIFELLLQQIVNNENENDISSKIKNSFDLIKKNLEHIYYNTRGAQVYRTEKDVNKLVLEITQNPSDV